MKSVLIFNDTSHDLHYGCDAVMSALVQGLHKHGVQPVYFSPVKRDWRLDLQKINSLEFDGIIVNGEGSIHDPSNRKKARELIALGQLGREKSRPTFLINSTLSKLRSEDFRSLEKFTAIFVREQESLNLLERNGIQGTVVPDLSFSSCETKRSPKNRNGIIFTDSVIPAVTNGLKAMASKHGTFIPINLNIKVSRTFSQRLTRKLKKVLGSETHPPVSNFYSPKTDFKDFIKQLKCCELLVTGRFHAVTLALATQTPFLAVSSNTHKIKSVVHDALGETSRVRDEITSIPALIEGDTSHFTSYSKDEFEALDKYNKTAQTSIDRMFFTISRTL